MVSNPTWLAASSGNLAQAGQVNQFLVCHGSTWVYAGTQSDTQATGNGVYSSTASTYLAQEITTGVSQTAIGQIWLQLSVVGGSPINPVVSPLTVSLYNSFNGLPTGTALASTSLAEQQVYTAPFWLPVPLVAAGLTPSTVYQVVVTAAGNGSAYYTWQHSNQVLGGSTSPDNTTWTSQAYGFMYQVFDQSAGGLVQFISDDGGARVVQILYNAQNLPVTLTESTIAQNGSVLYSTRNLAYGNGVLTGVS